MTLKPFAGYEDEIPEWIEWMKGLPFFLVFSRPPRRPCGVVR
jgi:hypothetical protein